MPNYRIDAKGNRCGTADLLYLTDVGMNNHRDYTVAGDSTNGDQPRTFWALSQRLNHNKEIDMTPTNTVRLASIISLALHLYIFSMTAVADSGANANSDLSYTYVRLNGASGEIDHRDSDGFGVAASFAFSDEFYLTAAHAKSDVDLYYANVDSERQRLGVGFHAALGNRTDLITEVVYANAKLTFDPTHTEDNSDADPALTLGGREHGYELTLGVRGMAGESLELQVGARYIDIDGHTETTGYFVADYFITEKISLGVGYEKSENSDAAQFNARYNF